MSVKATFAIDDGVLSDAREYLKNKHLKSLSAFVERSIREELARMRQEKIRSTLLSAGNDPLFMADVLEIQQAFESQHGLRNSENNSTVMTLAVV